MQKDNVVSFDFGMGARKASQVLNQILSQVYAAKSQGILLTHDFANNPDLPLNVEPLDASFVTKEHITSQKEFLTLEVLARDLKMDVQIFKHSQAEGATVWVIAVVSAVPEIGKVQQT